MAPIVAVAGLIVFGMTAVVYAVIAALIQFSQTGTRLARWLVGALVITAIWAAVIVVSLWRQGGFTDWLLLLDVVHTAVWVVFLAVLLFGSGGARVARIMAGVLIAGAVAAVAVVLMLGSPVANSLDVAPGHRLVIIALMALPLLGLFGLEQTFRNSAFSARAILRPLAIGVGLILVVDLFVYSHAVLLGDINLPLWSLRSVANLAAAPFIVLAYKKHPGWEQDLFVSRHVVFYTTGIMGTGAYLVAMGIGGSLVSARGGYWGAPLQFLFLVAATAVLFYALFSSSLRRRVKVWIAKNFYRNRYDYREEWLRLIATLASRSEASLPERSVRALANIVGSPQGQLWLASEAGADYVGYGAFGDVKPANALSEQDELVRFMRQTKWVVDTSEYVVDPEKYENAFGRDAWFLQRPSIFVPLSQDDRLIGIVRLERPKGLGNLSYEDHDLLKTAGKQVAIYLAQEVAQDALAQTRQFEAFGKLTTFLMHDLKNLIAQQELVVRNAQRFKHRPEFIDDAMQTIEAGVVRMRGLLDRLGSVARREHATRVNLVDVVAAAVQSCSDRQPLPQAQASLKPVYALLDQEKLTAAVVHAIRNAQDATEPSGRISVSLHEAGGLATIEVEDSGAGMDEAFLRDRLFRAFDSTKGAKGMGIGAYQIRETLRSIGGSVQVSSAPGKGTVFGLRVPVADYVEAAAQPATIGP